MINVSAGSRRCGRRRAGGGFQLLARLRLAQMMTRRGRRAVCFAARTTRSIHHQLLQHRQGMVQPALVDDRQPAAQVDLGRFHRSRVDPFHLYVALAAVVAGAHHNRPGRRGFRQRPVRAAHHSTRRVWSNSSLTTTCRWLRRADGAGGKHVQARLCSAPGRVAARRGQPLQVADQVDGQVGQGDLTIDWTMLGGEEPRRPMLFST